MSFEVKFTAKEHNEFLSISNALNLDDNTKKLSIVLYTQYKERTKQRVVYLITNHPRYFLRISPQNSRL